MIINTKEQQMFNVMKAIYDSSIPVNFIGSMVLKACLMEVGYSENIRHTKDIDGNWNTENPPTDSQIVDSIQEVLRKSNIDLHVSLARSSGIDCSAGLKLIDPKTNEIYFKMDISINRDYSLTKLYEIGDIHFRGSTPAQMIADKVSAVSTNKVFRRVKDVIDLYYLSHVFTFNAEDVKGVLEYTGRSLDSFDGFLNRKGDLEHAYNKFKLTDDIYKPPFDEVYGTVKSYIADILPSEKDLDKDKNDDFDIE